MQMYGQKEQNPVMVFSILLIAAAAAGQAPATAPAIRQGRAFMSPMGEPFFGRTPGEDGLVVWFEQADTNHDGALTVDEMIADGQRFYLTLDTDHDGEIGPSEISYYEINIAPKLKIRSFMTVTTLPGGEKDVQYDDESAAGRYGLMQIPEPVASADSNFSRGVTAEEFRQAATRRFAALDVDNQGKLTLDRLTDIRRAASSAVGRKEKPRATESDNPRSAEHGGAPPL
jgi:Ca2+-binding EF-hand superfamily protein